MSNRWLRCLVCSAPIPLGMDDCRMCAARAQLAEATAVAEAQSLAALIADARAREAAAARMPAAVYFGKRCISAFPSLYRHPAVRATRQVLPALRQWSFTLDGVEFLVRFQSGPGSYWTFHAWDASHLLGEHDASDFATPRVETALLVFVGAMLTEAEVRGGEAHR